MALAYDRYGKVVCESKMPSVKCFRPHLVGRGLLSKSIVLQYTVALFHYERIWQRTGPEVSLLQLTAVNQHANTTVLFETPKRRGKKGKLDKNL